MPRPADRRDAMRGRKPQRREPSPDIDRVWCGVLAVVVVALLLLIAKAATIAFDGAGRRVDVGIVD